MAKSIILRQLKELQKVGDQYFMAGPVGEDIYHWEGYIKGPPNSPYEGGVFRISIHYPPEFPMRPPRISFRTKVYHPNISGTGGILLDILRNEWSPILTIYKILMRLYLLLEKPVVEDGARFDEVIATMFVFEKQRFVETARSWTKTYAMEA